MTSAQQLADSLLPGCQPYIVLESQGPPPSVRLPGALAFTGLALDVQLEPWLSARGDWQGRRPAIFVDDDAIRKLALEASAEHGGYAAEIERHVLLATVTHEAAHVAQKGIDTRPMTDEFRELAEAAVAYSIAAIEDTGRPPFLGHDWRWVRLAIHLAHKANALGYTFPISFLFSGESYAITEAKNFAYALGREPVNLESESIFEINTFRPPLNFVRLWQRCVGRWIEQQPAGASGIDAATRLLKVYED